LCDESRLVLHCQPVEPHLKFLGVDRCLHAANCESGKIRNSPHTGTKSITTNIGVTPDWPASRPLKEAVRLTIRPEDLPHIVGDDTATAISDSHCGLNCNSPQTPTKTLSHSLSRCIGEIACRREAQSE
jgi:hypothetical protein